MARVYVHPVYFEVPSKLAKAKTKIISTVQHRGDWKELSPFILGPCDLYDSYTSLNMENAWQYSKVYKEHIAPKKVWPNTAIPHERYFMWAENGWSNPRAVRYPMGKGAKPEFSWWDGKPYGYVPARKMIYGPLYEEAVRKTQAFKTLQKLMDEVNNLVLLDYDAYDHRHWRMSLTDVLNNPNKKMGHAFVLAMMLTEDKALKQMELRK